MYSGVQSHEHEVVKLGPISMGERLRIGGDISSDDDMDEPTPSPPPSSPKRSHKRRVLPPRSIDSSEALAYCIFNSSVSVAWQLTITGKRYLVCMLLLLIERCGENLCLWEAPGSASFDGPGCLTCTLALWLSTNSRKHRRLFMLQQYQ